MKKPIICLDFDGVIHSYQKGWKDGSIYGQVTDGFFEWAIVAQKSFRLVVFSSRSDTPEGILAMRLWLLGQWQEYTLGAAHEQGLESVELEFVYEKPPAFLTIDDRAYRFQGNWQDPALTTSAIFNFKPWNVA